MNAVGGIANIVNDDNIVRDVRVNGTGLNLIQVRDGNRYEIASATFDGTNAAKQCI